MFYTNVEVFKNTLYYTGYDNDGKRQRKELKKLPFNTLNILIEDWEKIKTQFKMAISAEKFSIPYRVEKSQYKTVLGKETYEIAFPFTCSYKIKEYLKMFKIPIYNDIEYQYKFIRLLSQSSNYKVDTSFYKIAYFDIEVESEYGFPHPEEAKERINAISLKVADGKLYAWGLDKFYVDDPNIICKVFNSEKEMLKDFLEVWQELDLDIISGWNTAMFDIPYVVNRYKNLFGGFINHNILEDCIATKLSPFGIIKQIKIKDIYGSERLSYDFLGLIHVDYMSLYKKYTQNERASYSLNNISNDELGEGKLDYSEYENLNQLYKHNFQKFMEYNIRDSQLVEKINKKTRMMELGLTIMYKCFINFNDIFSPIRSWDSLIYNYLDSQKILINPMNDLTSNVPYPGAYVVPPKCGIYRFICSFDFNSLYPNVICQLNLSPETILEETYTDFQKFAVDSLEEDPYRISGLFKMKADLTEFQKRNLSLSANGNLFRKDFQGFMPKLVGQIYGDRKAYKKVMISKEKEIEALEKEYQNKELPIEVQNQIENLSFEVSSLNSKQWALKIMINSLYGSFASIYNRWFDIRFARSITLTAQTMNRHIKYVINQFLSEQIGQNKDFVATGDTDSIFGNSKIYVNNKVISIEDYFNSVPNIYLDKDDKNENFVKKIINEDYTYSVNKNIKLNKNKIKYVMKHKVYKQMYKLTVGNKSVNITCDHSLIILRNGNLISIKPKNILKTDKIITIQK